MKSVDYLTIVTERKHKDRILEDLAELNAQLINVIYSRDYIDAGELEYAFGLCSDDNEVLMCCIIPSEKIDGLFCLLIDKYGFDDPKTGIAFTTNIDKLSF